MPDFWDVPKLWPDSTVFVIGGGPSLLGMDISGIHEHRVIGVNQAYRLGPWVDACWYGDMHFYDISPELKNYRGLIATCHVQTDPKKRKPRVKYLGRSKQYGIEFRKKKYVAWNSNSGASAINFAYWLGAKRVVLLGFDMRRTNADGKTHWHDYYKRDAKFLKKNSDPYPRFMRGWDHIAKDADKCNLEIINSTPDSAITQFGYTPLEEVWKTL